LAVEFAEVFERGGFDVVLANPPYVRQELIKDLKPALKSMYGDLYSGIADLYVYFYYRAIQLLRQHGMLVFISSNKWFRANYGVNLRKYIAGHLTVHSITDFGDLPVFESATAYPMIFVAQKQKDEATDSLTQYTEVTSLQLPYPDVRAVIQNTGHALPKDAIQGENWALMDATTAVRLRTMRTAGLPLGRYLGQPIYRGLITGLNAAFVVDGAKRAELIAQDIKSADLIRPFATGRDIRRWTITLRDQWLIVTPIGVEIKRYPAIFAHLRQWQPQLEKRWDKGRYWWELRACDYYTVLDQPKIVFPDIAVDSRFALDMTGSYLGNTTYFSTTTLGRQEVSRSRRRIRVRWERYAP